MSTKGRKPAAQKEFTVEEKLDNLIARFDAFEQETHTVTAELRAQCEDIASKLMAMGSTQKTKGKNFTLTLATAAIMAAITDKSSFTHVKSTLAKLGQVKVNAPALKTAINEVFANYEAFSKKTDAEKKKELKKIVCREGINAADLQSEFGEKVEESKPDDTTDGEEVKATPKKGSAKAKSTTKPKGPSKATTKHVVDSDVEETKSDDNSDDEVPVKKPGKKITKSRQSRIISSDEGSELDDADVNDSD